MRLLCVVAVGLNAAMALLNLAFGNGAVAVLNGVMVVVAAVTATRYRPIGVDVVTDALDGMAGDLR